MASKGAYTLLVEDRFGAITDEYSFDSGDLVIGRSRQCDIVLTSENVSRRHARIRSTPTSLVLEDLQSANGVFVNGKRVHDPAELSDQDTIRLGDFHLHVRGGKRSTADKHVYVRLVGMNLTVTDHIFEITSSTTLVGRGKDCGLVLVDPSISRVHARLVVRPDGAVIAEDMGSANGVVVNGQRIKAWQVVGGDRLKVGNLEFLVELPGGTTCETAIGKGSKLQRVLGLLADNLPWVVAAVCAVTVGVLLAVFIPELSKPGAQRDAQVTQEVADAATARPEVTGAAEASDTAQPPAPSPAPAPATQEGVAGARSLLDAGKLDDAAREIAAVLAANPSNGEAQQVQNRIEAERAAGREVAAAEKAMTSKDFDDAARALLRVPATSMHHARALQDLHKVSTEIDSRKKRFCSSGKTIECVRYKALADMVRKAL